MWFYCHYLYIEEVPSLGQRFSETFDLWFFLEEEPGGLEFRSCLGVGGLGVYMESPSLGQIQWNFFSSICGKGRSLCIVWCFRYGKLIIIIGHKSMELLLVFMEGVREGVRERGVGVVFCEGSYLYKEGHPTTLVHTYSMELMSFMKDVAIVGMNLKGQN